MELLNRSQIAQKINRLALEILERNTAEKELFLLGINRRGLELAGRLQAQLQQLCQSPIHRWHLQLNPENPTDYFPVLDHPAAALAGKPVLLVDDVANTGRTLFYAMQPLLTILPKKIEVAVLVDRAHKSFPILVTYVGTELTTTLGDNVLVNFGPDEKAVLV